MARTPWPCSATSPREEQVNTAVQKVLERFGTVDVLVNNAGILSLKKPFVEYTKADWDKIFGINFMGDVFFCKAVIPTMKEKKAGRIINMASQSAETAVWPPRRFTPPAKLRSGA